MRPKLALCIFGNPRKFKTSFPSIEKNILSKIDTDIFISTWDSGGSKDTVWDTDEGSTEEFRSLYSPKAMEANGYAPGDPAYDYVKIQNEEHDYWLHGTSMFFNIHNCNRLKNEYAIKNNIVYDFVLSTRSDIEFVSPLSEKQMEELAYNRNLCFARRKNHERDFYAIEDFVALCSNESYDVYSSVFTNIDKLQEGGVRVDTGSPRLHRQATRRPQTKIIFNESILKNHLLNNKVQIKDIDLTYNLLR